MNKQADQGNYRHEYKYVCDARQNAVLKVRAAGFLRRDSHCSADGCYHIRSLYFDDLEDGCFYENEGGTDLRDKYRIRIYNADPDRIILEKKSKVRGMTRKTASPIPQRLCRQMMEGRSVSFSAGMGLSAPLTRLLLEMQEKVLRPVVIVDYVRYPFVDPNGNVRVTFDEALASSNDIERFLEKEIAARPVMEAGQSILEVKWDSYLPDHIRGHLQTDALQRSSFSKYYLCRKYNVYGGVRI